MKKLLLAMLCMCGLGLTQAMATDAVNQPALTIYNQNFFVARERLPMELKMGANHVAYSGIAAHLEPDSVILRDPAGRALQILEQNYRNDPISQELLLSFYEGKNLSRSTRSPSPGPIEALRIRQAWQRAKTGLNPRRRYPGPDFKALTPRPCGAIHAH